MASKKKYIYIQTKHHFGREEGRMPSYGSEGCEQKTNSYTLNLTYSFTHKILFSWNKFLEYAICLV